MVWAWQR